MNPEQRKAYLTMAERRAKPGAGSDPKMLRERTSHYGVPDLSFLKNQTAFAVAGGLATRLYMPERMTLDCDILIEIAELPFVESILEKAGCQKLGSLTIGGSTWRLTDAWNLDVIALDDAWVPAALRDAVGHQDGLRYLTLPYLVIMKLSSGRVQDLADISRMLGGADHEALSATRGTVRQYRPHDIEDLESLIRLGTLEYE